MSSPSLHALAHPLAITAVVTLFVNDHLLKAAWPGWWTGKLSDFAFCVLAPLVLAAPFGRWARLPAVVVTGVAFSILQLWPPLGAWFGNAHVADAADLVALPFLAVPLWIWRAERRAYGAAVLPLAVGALMGTTPAAYPPDTTWPCEGEPEVWDASQPLLLRRQWHGSIATDAFLRGLRLTDEDGREIEYVAVDLGDAAVAMCPVDGLDPVTTYTWEVGPWEESSQERRFSGSAPVTVTFTTGHVPGLSIDSAESCRAAVFEPSDGECAWAGARDDSG